MRLQVFLGVFRNSYFYHNVYSRPENTPCCNRSGSKNGSWTSRPSRTSVLFRMGSSIFLEFVTRLNWLYAFSSVLLSKYVQIKYLMRFLIALGSEHGYRWKRRAFLTSTKRHVCSEDLSLLTNLLSQNLGQPLQKRKTLSGFESVKYMENTECWKVY